MWKPIRICLLVVLWSWCGIALSQADQTLYLKDGSIIKGEIVEDSDYRVRMVIASGDTLTIGYKFVHSIGRANQDKAVTKKHNTPAVHLDNGRIVALSLGPTFSQSQDAGFQISLDAGQRLNNKLHIGGGLAYHSFMKGFQFIYVEHDFLSAHGYGRYYFNDAQIKYFVQAKIGYGVAVSDRFSRDFNTEYYDEYSGGLTSQLSFGTHFASREKFRFFAEFNLSYQKVTGSYGAFDWVTNLPITSSYDINYLRPGIKAGIEF